MPWISKHGNKSIVNNECLHAHELCMCKCLMWNHLLCLALPKSTFYFLLFSSHYTGLLWAHVDSPWSLPPPCQPEHWSAAPQGQVLWLLQQRSSRWVCWKSWRVSHCCYTWQCSFHILQLYTCNCMYTVASVPNDYTMYMAVEVSFRKKIDQFCYRSVLYKITLSCTSSLRCVLVL